ncbi:MAG TPA: hypothetical protein VHW09_08585, partial [Bryobacteraceae bacterium]|nr:hypothetical protein [Bryobacteraceae bacterium]
FGLTVILLLALGLGSNTVIFSFVNSLLLRRLPVRAPENLYLLEKNRARQVRPDTSFFYQQLPSARKSGTLSRRFPHKSFGRSQSACWLGSLLARSCSDSREA